MALRLVQKINGDEVAQAVQLGIEYDPDPPSTPARREGAEADRRAGHSRIRGTRPVRARRSRLSAPGRPPPRLQPGLRLAGERRPHGGMAAGQGTRMRSARPKVLHEVCGRPMIAWPVIAAARGRCAPDLRDRLAGPRHLLGAPERDRDDRAARGRRHGRRAPRRRPRGSRVADGRGPLGRSSSDLVRDPRRALAAHRDAGAAATVMTTELEDPGSYGRIIRGRATRSSGSSRRRRRATPLGGARDQGGQRRHLRVRGGAARRLGEIDNDNAQGEYYLGDVLPLLESRPGRRRVPRPRSRRQPRRERPRRPRARRGRGAGSSPRTCAPASRSRTRARPGSTPTSRSRPTRRSRREPRCAAPPASGPAPRSAR